MSRAVTATVYARTQDTALLAVGAVLDIKLLAEISDCGGALLALDRAVSLLGDLEVLLVARTAVAS